MLKNEYERSDSKNEWLSQFMYKSTTTIDSEQLASWTQEVLSLEINCSESMKCAIYNSINYDEIINKIWEFLEEEKADIYEINREKILEEIKNLKKEITLLL